MRDRLDEQMDKWNASNFVSTMEHETVHCKRTRKYGSTAAMTTSNNNSQCPLYGVKKWKEILTDIRTVLIYPLSFILVTLLNNIRL